MHSEQLLNILQQPVFAGNYTTTAVNELKNNITLTEKQIKVGTNNSFVLIRKQRDLLKSEMNLINLELQYRIERINLYMALGAENFIYS